MSAREAPRSALRMMAGDLLAAADPVAFATSAGMTPDPWQVDVLRSQHPRMLLNCSRQSGKSTVTALLALHQALFTPGSLVLLLSPSLRQSAELFRTLAGLYSATGAQIPSTAESKLRLELANGSRVISLPASEATIRGYAGAGLLVFDEASRVSDDLYSSMRPVLATSGGRLVALSTPYGRRGWWSDAWHSSHDWMRVHITAEQCPRISPAFLAEEREQLGDWWFRQEFLGEFLDAESRAFSSEDIQRVFSREIETWQL